MTHCRHIRDLRFLRIDNDPRDRPAVLKTDILPMLAAIGGSIYTIAPIGRIPIVGFAGAYPNQIRIGWRNCDRTDRERGLLVENRIKGHAVIIGFENAAVSEPDVKNKWIARIDRDIGNATAHYRRTDGARFQVFEKNIRELRRSWRGRRRNTRRQRWSRVRRRGTWRRAANRPGAWRSFLLRQGQQVE